MQGPIDVLLRIDNEVWAERASFGLTCDRNGVTPWPRPHRSGTPFVTFDPHRTHR